MLIIQGSVPILLHLSHNSTKELRLIQLNFKLRANGSVFPGASFTRLVEHYAVRSPERAT